jgi:hypothetical protein
MEQRDNLILEAERKAANIMAIEKERDALKLEVEQLRCQCMDAAALKNDRDRHILEAKRQASCMKAIKEERDAFKLEAERLRGQCMDAAALKEQRDRLRLEARRQARYTKAIKEERDALKLGAEHHRCQCMDTAALKEQLSAATVQPPELKKGRSALVIIVTMLILCFSVGLLWTLRDSPNMPSSHDSILSTAVPFHNIVV